MSHSSNFLLNAFCKIRVYCQPSVQLAVNSQEVCVFLCVCVCAQSVCYVKLALQQCNCSYNQLCGFYSECITPAYHVSHRTVSNYLDALGCH